MEAQHTGTWIIDPVHSRIRFETKYLLLTPVTGWFNEFEGTVTSPSNDFNACSIRFTLYTHSLNTQNDTRDKHLLSNDFFDADNFPRIVFQSTSVESEKDRLNISGNLTIKNVTAHIAFDARFVGSVQDPYGNRKAGFEMRTTLNRKDFNITWNNYFDEQGILLSDTVDIIADLQFLKIS